MSLGLLTLALFFFSTPAFPGVQPNGSFSHSIEIKIPPGTAGMQPKLSLVYNSNGDNGILGQGWHISGLPVITRMHNGKGINYYADDTYAVTNFGVKPDWTGKLVRVGNSGSQEIFHTNKESFTQYVAECDAAYIPVAGYCEPQTWTVTDPFGIRMEFGYWNNRIQDGPGANQFRVWMLNKVTDLHGNSYTISYDRTSDGEIYPLEIEYGNGHYVSFAYESRSDVSIDHLGASAYRTVYQKLRLKWVEVWANGMSVRKYKMFYGHTGTTGTLIDANTYAPSTGRSLLTAVQEYGSDGISTLPALVFGYENGGVLEEQIVVGPIWSPPPIIPPYAIPSLSADWRARLGPQVGDFNGDGFADILLVSSIAYSNGTTVLPFIHSDALPFSEEYLTDFNGDGKADLFAQMIPTPLPGISQMRYANSINSEILTYTGICASSSLCRQSYGDFNGDGRTDIFTHDTLALKVWISTGENFYPITLYNLSSGNGTWRSSLQFSNWLTARLGDFNGDGKIDIFVRDETQLIIWLSTGSDIVPFYDANLTLNYHAGTYNLWYPFDDPVFPWRSGMADVNGDGKIDVFVPDSIFALKANISDGSGPSFSHQFGDNLSFLFGDFNGDGIVDFRSSPDAFNVSSSVILSRLLSQVTYFPYLSGDNLFHYDRGADIDGDGKSDLIRPNCGNCQPSDWSLDEGKIQIRHSTSGTPDLLTTINNGAGSVTTVTYKPAPQVPGAVDPSQSVYPVIANSSPRNLVTQVTTSDGRGASYSTQYQYHNGKIHTGTLDQRKDLGFEWVREVNVQTGAYTQTWYDQSSDLAMTAIKTESFAGGAIPGQTAAANYGRLMSRSTMNYSVLPAVANQTKVVRLDAKVTQTYEFGSLVSTQRQTLTYDDAANFMRTLPRYVTDEADGTTTVVTETTYAPADQPNWILARPIAATTRSGSITGPILNQTQFIYDGSCGNVHNMCKRNDWLDLPTAKWITTSFAYDSYGNVTDITDALGHNSHIDYDAVYHAQPVRVRNALGHEVISTFDARYGALLTQTDPNNGTTEQVLDVFGRPVESRINGLLTQSIVYNDNLTGSANQQFIETRVVEDTAPDGYTFARNYYDGMGRTYRKESSGPNLSGIFYTLVTETGFDTAGRKAAESHPYLYPRDLPVITAYQYDNAGRVNRIDFPEGTSTTIAYSVVGMRTFTTTTDAQGNTKTTVQNSRGQTLAVVEGDVSEVQYEYDALGQLTRVVDADGLDTTIRYDSLGHKTGMTEPNTGNWLYAYDDLGNLTTQTDPKGQVITFAYDALNRLTQKILPAGGGTNVSYTYDNNTVNGIGRLTRITDAAGVMNYSYDTRGNVTAWRQTVAGKTYSFQAAYDLQNRLQKLTYPDGEFVENYYAESGYLKQVRLKNPDKVWGAPVVTYFGPETTGDPDVLQLNRLAGNNVLTKIGFDRHTMKAVSLQTTLADAAQTVVEDVTFAPDSVGNITQVIDNLNANKTQTFEYDSLYRLTRAQSVAYGNLTYSYSPGGNLLSKEGIALSYGNPQHPQAVTQAGANTYTYDANANMVTRNGRDLVYDAADRLTQITLAGVAKQTFTYDHSGQRVVKSREDGTTVISLSGLYEVMRLPDNSERHTKYIFGIAGEMVSQITRDGATITLTQQQIFTQNLLALSSFHGSGSVQGPFMNAYFAMDYFFANPRATRITLLVFFIGLCLALFIVILRSRLRGEENPYARTNPRLAAVAPLVLFFAIFEFGLLGCSASSTAVENATPWSDLPPAPPGNPEDIANQNYGDTSTAGFPVLGAYFMHPNHVGSPALITNAAGTQVLTKIMHRPYGEIVRNPAYTSGPDITRYKFTGQEEDAESGLVYMNARFYDPAIGRFITSDSEFGGQGTQGFNRQMYGAGNPIKYRDPTGHENEDSSEPEKVSPELAKAREGKGSVDEKGNGRGKEESLTERAEKANHESSHDERSYKESTGSEGVDRTFLDRAIGEVARDHSPNISANISSSGTFTNSWPSSMATAQAAPVPVTTDGGGAPAFSDAERAAARAEQERINQKMALFELTQLPQRPQQVAGVVILIGIVALRGGGPQIQYLMGLLRNPLTGQNLNISFRVSNIISQLGGNPTVYQNGQPLFRFRASGHGSDGPSVTNFMRNVVDGKTFFNPIKQASPLTTRELKIIEDALKGKNGLSIQTKGGR